MHNRNMLLSFFLVLNSLGVLAEDPELRIVGGYPVSIIDRPFQISIYRGTQSWLQVNCGGTIIGRRWILTAAHCVINLETEFMVIRAGSDLLHGDKKAVWYKVERVIPHELFNPDASVISHDIALIITTKTIEFDPKIKPITVRKQSPAPSTKAIVSGFGVTEEGSTEMSDILRQVPVKVLGRDECVKLVAQLSQKMKVSTTHFCAANLEGGRDACQGDSGGPITIDGSLAGIVSWGFGCATKMSPAFYTDVSLFIPWIEKTIKEYSRTKGNKM